MSGRVTELLPCPFCGGEAAISLSGNARVGLRYLVKCTGCRYQRTDAALRHGEEWLRNVAISGWNTRAAPHMREGEAVPAAHVMVNGHGQMVELRYNTGHGYNFTVADFLHADQVLPDGAPHTGRLLYTAPPKADAVDLEQFREAVHNQYEYARIEARGEFGESQYVKDAAAERDRLLAIIDSSRSKP